MKEKKLYLIILAIIIILLIIGFSFAKYVTVVEQEITVVLKDAKIKDNEIIIEPDYWTNDNVKLTVQTDKAGDIYYKKNEDGKWIKYEGELNIEENCDIYVKLVYEDGEGPETIKKITKISKPTEEVARVTTDKFSVIFDSVQAAIDAAETDDAVVELLYNGSREETAVVKEGQNITLETNSATLTSTSTTKSTIENFGTLVINGTGKITSTNMGVLTNNGTAILGGTVEFNSSAEECSTVVNNGNLTVSGARIISEKYKGIYNGDTNQSDKVNLTISSGTIIANTDGIDNNAEGTVEIIDGTIQGMTCIKNNVGGTINIKNGTITNTSVNSQAIQNCEDGNINVSGGTITAYNHGIRNASTGTVTVTGGTITSINNSGIYNVTTGTVTVGTNESTPNVSITVPSITGKSSGIDNNGTFNFYDGVIKGQSGSGSAIGGNVTKTATGYVVNKTIDGTVETALLGPSAPVVTAKLTDANGATYTSGTWTNKDIYISLQSANVGAGIKEYQRYLNGAWTTSHLTTSNNVGTITFIGDRNETVKFRAVDNNGVISQESSIVLKKDSTLPTITVSPASATVCKTKSVTITVKDEGGSRTCK